MLSGDVVVQMAYFCSMWTVLLMERVCRDWRTALTYHRHLWRHLMLLQFPRMRTLLPRLPSPLQHYRTICRNQCYAERRRMWSMVDATLPSTLPPLDAYTFTVEIAEEGKNVKNVCSDRLVFDKVRTDNQVGLHIMDHDFAVFRCASPLWTNQPQWFSWLDYQSVHGYKRAGKVTIRAFVTQGNCTRIFYESTVLCDVDGSIRQEGILRFDNEPTPLVSLPRGSCNLLGHIRLVVHGGEPDRPKKQKRHSCHPVILYNDHETADNTGDVLFFFQPNNMDVSITNETSAVRFLERHLASYQTPP